MLIKRDNILEALFFIGYMFMMSFSFLGHIPVIGGYLNVLSKISLFIFLFITVLQINNFKTREIMSGFFLLIVSMIIAYRTNDNALLKLVLILLAIKNVNFEKCIKFDLILRCILIFITIVLCIVGIAPDIVSYNEGEYKHSLGFSNPNSFGMHTLILCFEIIFLAKNKLSFFKSVLIIGLLLVVDSYAGCRTSFAVFCVVFILKKIIDYFPKILNNSFSKFFIKNSFCIMSIITFILFLLYKSDTNIGMSLNSVLSNRLFNIYTFSLSYPLNWLGNDLTTATVTLDTLFAYLLFAYGIAVYLMLIIEFKKLFNFLYKNEMNNLIIIFLSFVIYGISERIWFLVDYNIFMIAFSYILFTDKRIIELKNK